MERSKISIIYIWFGKQSYLPPHHHSFIKWEKQYDIYEIITIKIMWLGDKKEVTELWRDYLTKTLKKNLINIPFLK